MDWSNERYVRLYTRDTTTWRRLGWDGQCMLMQLLRRADRAGVIDIEDMQPAEAAELHTSAPPDAAFRGVAKLLELGVMVHDGTRLVFPSYIEANETPQSDSQRQRESRERRRVTKRDGESRNVTESHAQSRAVTSCHSVPSVLSLPNHAVPEEARAASRVSSRSSVGDPPSAMRVGEDLMVAATGLPWGGAWRNDLELIGLKPLAEREAALRALQGEHAGWASGNSSCTPAHVVKHWNKYAFGRKPIVAAGPAANSGTPHEQAQAKTRAAERAYRAAKEDPTRKGELDQLRATWVALAHESEALREKCA
jgi:hypothetical protein